MAAASGTVESRSGNVDQALANPAIDAPGFVRETLAAIERRESRRLTEADFLRLAAEPDTVVLDARSRDKFAQLHVRGAVSLPFTDFTAESLRRAIPATTTRVLIYCNNNFAGAEEPFPTKLPPASLNLSTYVALATYGYDDVWELGPLVEIAAALLPFEGTLAAPTVASASPSAGAV